LIDIWVVLVFATIEGDFCTLLDNIWKFQVCSLNNLTYGKVLNFREFCKKAFTVTLAAMFLGAMPRRPDKAEAHKTLRQHLTYLGLWICAIRAAPFIFALVSKQNEQLELDFD
jgi:hypothetical protein